MKPRWRPTVRHEYADGPNSYCGLCGRRWGNPIHRKRRIARSMIASPLGRPSCAECGRSGYYSLNPELSIAGHLDQRIKHRFVVAKLAREAKP